MRRETEENHHEPDWIDKPGTCVCDVFTWDLDKIWDLDKLKIIPPACNNYDGDGEQNCKNCEHDERCHTIQLQP